MDATLILPRIVGVFYLLSGIVSIHVMATDSLMDRMLAALTLKPTSRAEVVRRWFLVSGSYAVGLSGAALVVLSLWAVPLFLAASALQLGWLLWARKGYPVTDEADARGRSQTTNAALIYGVMTALVAWLGFSSRLQDWLDPWALFIPMVAIVLGLFAARHLLWKAANPHLDSIDDQGGDRAIPPPPTRIRLAPMKGFYPIRDADNDDGVIYGDYVPGPLADRIYAWIQAFRSSDDWDDSEFWAEFPDAEAEAAHRAEGDALVAELRLIFGEVEGPTYPEDIRYIP